MAGDLGIKPRDGGVKGPRLIAERTWQEWKDSNLRKPESASGAVAAGPHPYWVHHGHRVVAEFLGLGSMPLDPPGLRWRPLRMSLPFGIALHGWSQTFLTGGVAIGIPLGTSPLTPGVHARHQQHRQAELRARRGKCVCAGSHGSHLLVRVGFDQSV